MKRSCHICQNWFYPFEMFTYDTCKNCMYSINTKKINRPQGLYDLGSID